MPTVELLFRSAGLPARETLRMSGPAPGQFLAPDELDAAGAELAAHPWLRHALA